MSQPHRNPQLTDEELNTLIRKARRRSRSSQVRKDAVLAARAGHRASEADSYFRGVKPKCTEGRHYSVKVADSDHILVIQETTTQEKSPSYKISLPCSNSEECRRPAGLYGRLFKRRISKPRTHPPCTAHTRIIGRPIVIGCRSNTMVLQYLSDNWPIVRFLLVNIKSGTVKSLEDSERYFLQQFVAICPIECLISPGFSKILFRLPQPIMNTRSWSKLLSTDMSVDSDGICHVGDIKADCLSDRQNQGVAFDPRRPCCVTFLMVDEYCTKCELRTYDVSTKMTLLQNSCRLSRFKPVQTEHEETSDDSGSDEEVQEPDRYRFLLKCYVDYCKSGDVIVLCCVVKDGGLTSRKLYSCLYFFNSDTLQLMNTAITEVPVEIFSRRCLFDARKHWFGLIFNAADTKVSVCFLEYGTCVENPPILTVSLPKTHQLKAMCRQVILQACTVGSLDKLPLPGSLINFLHFQQTFYVI
ncbi:hypothetical protein LSAT2_028051 [Lamellibrachia satsuma]|nr:hypothetical protein LSAT2_028051 [Lamellibrachia satsuma]